MIDIVNRLRFDATRCEAQFSKGVAGNITDAADEIEQLREALKLMTEWASNVVETNEDSTEIERCRALASGQGAKVT